MIVPSGARLFSQRVLLAQIEVQGCGACRELACCAGRPLFRLKICSLGGLGMGEFSLFEQFHQLSHGCGQGTAGLSPIAAYLPI